jgi:hypothetical protein
MKSAHGARPTPPKCAPCVAESCTESGTPDHGLKTFSPDSSRVESVEVWLREEAPLKRVRFLMRQHNCPELYLCSFLNALLELVKKLAVCWLSHGVYPALSKEWRVSGGRQTRLLTNQRLPSATRVRRQVHWLVRRHRSDWASGDPALFGEVPAVPRNGPTRRASRRGLSRQRPA